MRGPALLLLGVLVLAGTPAPGALQVSAEPERVSPVSLGEARVWNAYVTVTVLRDGRPEEGAAVELKGPAGILASGRADAEGKTVLPVLSREPLSIEVWVDGAPSGRRVALVAGSGASAPSPAAAPQPQGFPGGAAGGAVVAAGAAATVALLLRRIAKRGGGGAGGDPSRIAKRGGGGAGGAGGDPKKRFKRRD